MYSVLFSHSALMDEVENGYVRINAHPEADLWILNYTEKAAYEGRWNDVTLNCRGLIVDLEGNIVARPFPKFFNYGQPGCPEIDLDEPAVVSDKMDGSLGILYPVDGGYAIATRGSFTSDQAIHATEILRTKYAGWKPVSGYTYLFEIVYPENRIVCDYAGMDDLVCIGIVNNDNGASFDADFADFADALLWNGPVAEVFPYQTMREAISAPPRKGKEGFVVHLLNSDVRVKIKQEDYIQLHRIVTGLNARSVWEAMLTDSVDELIEKVPDEFHDFVRGVETEISNSTFAEFNRAYIKYNEVIDSFTTFPTKKDFALIVKNHDLSWALFKMWDRVPQTQIYMEFLYRNKPAHDFSPVKVSNDAD